MFKFAIEIKTDETYNLLLAIWPHIAELNKEEVMFQFLVFDIDNDGTYALVGPGALTEGFDHIENGAQITIKKLFVK